MSRQDGIERRICLKNREETYSKGEYPEQKMSKWFKELSHTIYECKYHIICCTKYDAHVKSH